MSASFKARAVALNLRFRCAACAHVVPSTRACSLGYPNAGLRGPWRAEDADGRPTFCKFFELGEESVDDPPS